MPKRANYKAKTEFFEALERLSEIVERDPRVLEAVPEPKRSLVRFLLQAYKGGDVLDGEKTILYPV